jgi:transposase
VVEGGLANVGGWGDLRRAAGVRGRDGRQHLAGAPVCLVATGGAGARKGAAQLGGERHTLLASMGAQGMGPCLAVEGPTTREVFEVYLKRVLAPSLRPGQVVVMDNLSSHRGPRVRKTIEARGCELVYLPPYSPDLNPIEEAFAKLKALLRRAGARTREALIEAMGRALDAVTASDTQGFFEHRGYRAAAQLL